MKITAVIALGIALWVPLPAGAGQLECNRLTQQIEHYSAMVDRAHEFENAMWAERTQDHLNNLVARRAAGCPGYGASEQAMQAFADLMRIAGRLALTYFTFGAF